jgi:hypothetical protein
VGLSQFKHYFFQWKAQGKSHHAHGSQSR